MSVDNFIQTVWSGTFIAAKRKASVATLPIVVNRNWEGDLKNSDTVKINRIGDVTISDYTKNSTTVTYSPLNDASVMLKADKKKYFSFLVDDVDKAQAKGDVKMMGMEEAAYKMKDTQDSDVLSTMATEAGVKTGLGTVATPLDITAADTTGSYTGIVDLLSLIWGALDEESCPTDNRFIIVPPTIMRKIKKAAILDIRSTTQQQEAMNTGLVQTAGGFQVLVSNNLTNSGTVATPKWNLLAGVSSATTFAEQINMVEAFRLQSQIGDGVRGLLVYGTKVVLADRLARAICTVAAG